MRGYRREDFLNPIGIFWLVVVVLGLILLVVAIT